MRRTFTATSKLMMANKHSSNVIAVRAQCDFSYLNTWKTVVDFDYLYFS